MFFVNMDLEFLVEGESFGDYEIYEGKIRRVDWIPLEEIFKFPIRKYDSVLLAQTLLELAGYK